MGGKIALVDEYGAYLRVKEGRFQLKVGEEVKWDVAPVELDAIVFTVSGASISASAIQLASQYGIDLLFLHKNKPLARLIPATYGSTLKTWSLQAEKAEDPEFTAEIAKRIVEAKVHNQRMVVMEYARRYRASGRPNSKLEKAARTLDKILSKTRVASSPLEAMELEAQAAKYYWRAVCEVLPESLGFRGRIKRGDVVDEVQVDPFNKALNIGYGILRSQTWRATFVAGLNPYISFLHKFRSGRMSLVLDLMEPFRPISVDRPLISLARTKSSKILKLKSSSKERSREGAVEVWRTIINYMAKAKPPHEALILEQARSLARKLRGTGDFKPYKSRW